MKYSKKDPIAQIAYFISIVFHPLLMPTLFFAIILFLTPYLIAPWNQEGKYMFLGMIAMFTLIFPLLSSYLIFHSKEKQWSSFLHMENKNERFKPFILVGLLYLLFAYMLHQQLKLNRLIIVVLCSIAVAIIVSGIISYFWKVSIHAVGISGILGFLLVLNEWYVDGELFYTIITFILISGCVLSARLYLNQHSPAQVWVGYLVGLSISLAGMLYFK